MCVCQRFFEYLRKIKKLHYVSIRRQQAIHCLGDADRVRYANRSIPPRGSHVKKQISLYSVSAHIRFTPAMHFQRACRQCVHESARLPRALCSHAWVWLKLWGERQNRRLSLCLFPHALATHYFLRLTRARGRRFLRGWKILLNDFCRAFGHSKAR